MGVEDRPRRGRPPLSWLGPRELAALPPGVGLLVDPGTKGARPTGRVVAVEGGALTLRMRDLRVVEVPLSTVTRGRVVNSLFEEGDPVVLRDSGERGGVVRTQGPLVMVETTEDYRWVHEQDVEHADDWAARTDRRRGLPRQKPGPASRDHVAEAAAQVAFQAKLEGRAS